MSEKWRHERNLLEQYFSAYNTWKRRERKYPEEKLQSHENPEQMCSGRWQKRGNRYKMYYQRKNCLQQNKQVVIDARDQFVSLYPQH